MNPSATPGESPAANADLHLLKKLGLMVVLVLLFAFWYSTGISSLIALMTVYWPLCVLWLIVAWNSKRGSPPVTPTSENPAE
ncbi:MAG TPA: hypothetical protein VGG30_11655 [Pirellulales bacterium]